MINKTSPNFLNVLRAERRDLLERMRQTRFETLKDGYSHAQIIPFATYAPWLDDAGFADVYALAKSSTLVDVYRCYELYRLAQQCARLAGEAIEIGVWRGGTAAVIARALPEKTLHLFDTFSGVAKCDAEYDTLYSGGEHSDADEHSVVRLLETIGANCRIHRGIFPDDTLAAMPDRVCFAHIDVDSYRSVLDSFNALWPRVESRGIVVFDDYGTFGCEGATLAVNEIVASHRDGLFVHNLNGHALFIKQP
ncbi:MULTISPECIES: TylF/MycF/NovP-related O-methyltransferase [Burkholderia]|uniref:TylF/MycF/NovP-related O-methyltransferase n=1 Tax=Burkholderia TaxID=32008 RepID=UPI000A81A9BF|nr:MULTISPECIES: TylF/MycF/NovP-related O-methyltransferase [Burkholderia]